MLDLTPEQQAVFDRVVSIVTKNAELRQQYKTAIEELHKQPNWDNPDYMVDSDDIPAVNARAANDAIDTAIRGVEPDLAVRDSWLFDDVCIAICKDFREN